MHMNTPLPATACWTPLWSPGGQGLEHVCLTANSADSVLLAVDEDGTSFRLAYRLHWDDRGRLRRADLEARKGAQATSLALEADGHGRWRNRQTQQPLDHLDGCIDIDIWPTPLTNSFPLWRSQFDVGQRQEFRMAWVAAPDLTVEAKPQAYTRLSPDLFRFESLDGSGFQAELRVDEHELVVDYPGLFRRVP